MTIDDINIEIKKKDKFNRWIVNLLICDTFEIRGFIWSKSQYATNIPSGYYLKPPTIQSRSGAKFWLVECVDKNFWGEIQIKVEEEIAAYKKSIGELDDEEVERTVKEWE